MITSKLLIRYTQYLKYCIVVLFPSLHQFFRKFGRMTGSWRPSLIFFFVKLGPCHPDNFKAALLDCINFSESSGKYPGHGRHL